MSETRVVFDSDFHNDPILGGFDAIDIHVYEWLIQYSTRKDLRGFVSVDVLDHDAISEACRIPEGCDDLPSWKRAKCALMLIETRCFNGRRLVEEQEDGSWYLCEWEKHQFTFYDNTPQISDMTYED